MPELRQTVGKNLTNLRKKKGLTQQELALKLSYSDKAISKWEHGDALPPLENLVEICRFYGVTLDDLTHEDMRMPDDPSNEKTDKRNRLIITLLSVFLVWLIATAVYVAINIILSVYYWQVFLFAVPVSCIVLIVFTSIWGDSRLLYLEISGLVWGLIGSIFCSIGDYKLWLLFILGIPAEAIIVIWSQLKRKTIPKGSHHSDSKSQSK
jgi:transcriptional regulator with XRE-family HTH domain